MNNNYEKTITEFHRRVVAVGAEGDIIPCYPDIFVYFGSADPSEAAGFRQSIMPDAVMIYLFAADSTADEVTFYRKTGADQRNLFLAVGRETFFADRVSMAVTLIRHRRVVYNVAHEVAVEFKTAAEMIDRAIHTADYNYRFTRETRLYTLSSLIDNLPVMCLRRHVRLAAGVPGCPAVVCGAGPSLASAFPLLREYRDRLFIIAVGHAFKAMMQAGITPDMVAEMDYISWINWRHDYNADIPLLAAATAAPAVTSRFQQLIWTACSGMEPELNALLREADMTPMKLEISRTVTVTALDFAVKNGFPAITLIGNDLAIGPAGETHAGNVTVGTSPAALEQFPVPANLGGQVMTTENFFGLKQVIESYVQRQSSIPGAPVICNSTNGGAKIEHAAYLPLAEFCARYAATGTRPGFQTVAGPPDMTLPETLRAAANEYLHTAREIANFSSIMRHEMIRKAVASETIQQVQSMLRQYLEQENRLRAEPPFSLVVNILSLAADDILARASHPERADSLTQLSDICERFDLIASMAEDILERLEVVNGFLVNRQIPEGFGSDGVKWPFFQSYFIKMLRKDNPELSAWLVAEPEGMDNFFAFLPTHQSAPRVTMHRHDGTAVALSHPPEAPGRYVRELKEFLRSANYNPEQDGVIFLAPGDWQHLVVFGGIYSKAELIVIEPFLELLRELIRRGLFIDRLPPNTQILTANEATPGWRRLFDHRFRQWRRDNRRILVFVNPLADGLPEVAGIMSLLGLK